MQLLWRGFVRYNTLQKIGAHTTQTVILTALERRKDSGSSPAMAVFGKGSTPCVPRET